MNKKIISVITAFSLAIGFCGCGKSKDVPAEAGVVATNVEVAEATIGSIESTVTYNGSVKSVSTGSVAPKASGAVTAIYVQVGDKVKAGQVLMTIDETSYKHSLSQAQAAYAQAEAGYSQAQASLAQTESSRKSAEAAYAQAQAGYNQALAAYDSAVAAYENVKNGSTVQTEININQSVSTAQSAYDTALDNYNRQKALFDIGAISQVALDSAKTSLDNALVALNTAKQNAEVTSSVTVPQSIAGAEAGVNQARAALQQAEAGKMQAQAGIDQANFAVGQINATIEQAKAGMEQAKVAVNMAKDSLANCKVKAPISGYIASKNVVIGQTAAQGVEAFSVKNPDLLEVEINVTEAVIGSLEVGTKAVVTVKSAGDEQIEGNVSALGETKDAVTGLYLVKVSVPSAGGAVKDGMIAATLLTTGSVENAVIIPQDSVFVSDEETYVYVAEGDIAVKKTITTGMSDEEHIEVLTGLTAGEKVITEGREFLSEKNNAIKIVSGD